MLTGGSASWRSLRVYDYQSSFGTSSVQRVGARATDRRKVGECPSQGVALQNCPLQTSHSGEAARTGNMLQLSAILKASTDLAAEPDRSALFLTRSGAVESMGRQLKRPDITQSWSRRGLRSTSQENRKPLTRRKMLHRRDPSHVQAHRRKRHFCSSILAFPDAMLTRSWARLGESPIAGHSLSPPDRTGWMNLRV